MNFSFEHTSASWAVRHTEWATSCLVKSGVEVEGSGVIKQSWNESHTGTAAPKNIARSLEKIMFHRRDEESQQPRYKVAWVVAMQGADVAALVCIGKISGYGTWRWSPDCDKKKTVEDRMRALSQLKLTHRRPPSRLGRPRIRSLTASRSFLYSSH